MRKKCKVPGNEMSQSTTGPNSFLCDLLQCSVLWFLQVTEPFHTELLEQFQHNGVYVMKCMVHCLILVFYVYLYSTHLSHGI